jgi:arylsulfatase A-like enzyme
MYRIPIVFYHPKKLIQPKLEKKIFQQIDILPTVLDAINIKTKYYSFGNSYFQKTNNEGITYLEGTYQYFFNRYMFTFSNDKARNLYDFTVLKKHTKDYLKKNKKDSLKAEKRLKAIIQCYNRDLIQNKTLVE